MARSLQNIIVGVTALVAFAILAVAPAHADAIEGIEIESALGCAQSISVPEIGTICLAPTPGAGNFTITNDTTNWDVTGFVVTDDPVTANNFYGESIPSTEVLALTTRADWTAAATNIGVDPSLICEFEFDGECVSYLTTYAAYEPQFSYSGTGNYILPGESDGSFNWEETPPEDPTYVIDLANADGATDVCTGSLDSLANPSVTSTCDPMPLISVPEPATLFLLSSGLIGLGLLRRRRPKAA